MPTGMFTVTLSVRGVWRVRLLLAVLWVARYVNVIQSNDHAVDIARRLTPRLLRYRVGRRGVWRRMEDGSAT